MEVFLCLLLLPLVSCSLENEDQLSKQGLDHRDHRSNLALLHNLNFENKLLGNIDPIPSPAPGIVNVGNPADGTIPVTINTENLALGNPNALPNGLQFPYAPAFPQNINTPSLDNNVIYFTGERNQAPALSYANVITPGFSLVASPSNLQNGAVNNVQDNRNLIQTYAPQNVVEVPQAYPVQVIREIKVPQPYPVHITRTVQVPVQVRVPVEVPKPYAVRVPHPVPVPVHIKVPVTVEKPYPVQITKTIAVPVEKPVYIKVPQPIQVPVPQPYPVAVPQPIQVQVPFIVRLPDAQGQVQAFLPQTPLVSNFEAFPAVPGPPALPELNPIGEAKPVAPLIAPTEPSASTNSTKPSLPPITGNGLLPPHPPSNSESKSKPDGGLLNSYVSSKEGGVYRRGTEYQTNEYKITW